MISPKAASLTGTSSSVPSEVVPKKRVLFVFGTRPEAIKLCPLIAAFRGDAFEQQIDVQVCVTAQHRQMLDQVLEVFQIKPDYDLNAMLPGQTLTTLTARLLAALEPIIMEQRPDMIVVQGDTTSTLCGALAAFYAGIPIAHVEAGLRTFDLDSPFPEEMNRVITGRLAALHFAATEWAAGNLLKEGVPPESILVTGNTGIDAVLSIRDAFQQGIWKDPYAPAHEGKRLIVVTAHRRESFGDGLFRICEAIRELAQRPDTHVVWPVHPNPHVKTTVFKMLGHEQNVELIQPLDYLPFVELMSRAYLLITDSGGVQEEGPSLGKPILVLRDKTERPEAVTAGTVKLVGTDRSAIVAEATRLLDDPEEYERMARLHNPYGDGKASGRIAARILAYWSEN